MKLSTRFVLIWLMVFLASATRARADSDAFFCTAKGYLAYETRKGVTPDAVGHVLKVVRFESNRGIYLAGVVTLADFQVYHLICSEDRIEISGWHHVFTKYVIDIAKSGEPTTAGPTEYPGRQWSDAAKDGPHPESLSIFGPHVAPLPLESPDPHHGYQLLRNVSSTRVKEGWEWHSKSELVQVDSSGRVTQRFLLYERRTVLSSE